MTFVKPPEPERPDKDDDLEDAAEEADIETVVHEGQRGFRFDGKE